MNQLLLDLIKKYSQKGIFIDTNILLLFFVGAIDKNLISNFKRTNNFVIEDYDLLLSLVEKFNKIITTPYVLTEVNSMGNQLQSNYKLIFYDIFSKTIENNLVEIYNSSKNLSKIDLFNKFGLTDTSIENSCKGKFLVLTDDFRLSQFLSTKNIDNINFNHIRTQNWK